MIEVLAWHSQWQEKSVTVPCSEYSNFFLWASLYTLTLSIMGKIESLQRDKWQITDCLKKDKTNVFCNSSWPSLSVSEHWTNCCFIQDIEHKMSIFFFPRQQRFFKHSLNCHFCRFTLMLIVIVSFLHLTQCSGFT